MFLFIKKEISNKVVLVLALRCGCGHTDIKKRESFARYVVGVSTPVPLKRKFYIGTSWNGSSISFQENHFLTRRTSRSGSGYGPVCRHLPTFSVCVHASLLTASLPTFSVCVHASLPTASLPTFSVCVLVCRQPVCRRFLRACQFTDGQSADVFCVRASFPTASLPTFFVCVPVCRSSANLPNFKV